MSVSKDVELAFVGLTPNPVSTNGAYLIQIGATEDYRTWGDWSGTTWGDLASMEWGSD